MFISLELRRFFFVVILSALLSCVQRGGAESTSVNLNRAGKKGQQAAVEDQDFRDQLKLFRNHPEIRFSGQLHEQVLPSIQQLGGTNVFVSHSNSCKRRKESLATGLLQNAYLQASEQQVLTRKIRACVKSRPPKLKIAKVQL
ncbi:MAG: hypothetical protein N2C14_14920 [Planctomycetales bacterium]